MDSTLLSKKKELLAYVLKDKKNYLVRKKK
jgi:hypothetical protein